MQKKMVLLIVVLILAFSTVSAFAFEAKKVDFKETDEELTPYNVFDIVTMDKTGSDVEDIIQKYDLDCEFETTEEDLGHYSCEAEADKGIMYYYDFYYDQSKNGTMNEVYTYFMFPEEIKPDLYFNKFIKAYGFQDYQEFDDESVDELKENTDVDRYLAVEDDNAYYLMWMTQETEESYAVITAVTSSKIYY